MFVTMGKWVVGFNLQLHFANNSAMNPTWTSPCPSLKESLVATIRKPLSSMEGSSRR